jgi:hypothetical protein
VKNIKILFRGESYTIKDGVGTFGELMDKFQDVSGLTSEEYNTNSMVWKGRFLRRDSRGGNIDLSTIGMKNGDRVLFVPVGGVKVPDLLGYMIFMATSDEKKSRLILQSLKAGTINDEYWIDFTEKLRSMNRKDVSYALRMGFDLAYHKLRSWWENPVLRQELHDPIYVEQYRKAVSTNVAPTVLEVFPSRLKRAIQSPDIWFKDFQKVTSAAVRFGDTIMDGILDLLLDVLKQSNTATNTYSSARPSSSVGQDYNTAGRNSSYDGSPRTWTDPQMDDPSLANDLLYELSESDDE